MKTEILSGRMAETCLYVLADPHYLSPSLFQRGSASFQLMLERNDAKMMEDMPSVLELFVHRALRDRPDAVLCPGDLTMNGEYVSLMEMKAALERIRDAGIAVLVLPGNHDIAFPYAMDVSQDVPVRTGNVSQQLFLKEMGCFGYEQALFQAEDSFSYAFALKKDLWLIGLDSNTEKKPGEFTEDTLAWLKTVISAARESGVSLISMTHQNLLKQSRLFQKGFVADNADAALSILKPAVFLNLSGHSHLQHCAREDGFVDLCSESAAVWPLGFSRILLKDNTIRHERERTSFSQKSAKERIDTWLEIQLNRELSRLVDDPLKKEAMIRFGTELGRDYYADCLDESRKYTEEAAWSYWQEVKGKSFWEIYLEEIVRPGKQDSA